MKVKVKSTAVILSIALLSMVLVFGGCTKYASQDDLDALDLQRQAALSAEERVQELEREKADLEEQISQKQQELREKEDLLTQIKGR